MTEPSRPSLRWHGSKWKIAPWVISHFPAHRVYVEPFGGAAGVLLRKQRVRSEIYNDLNGELVSMFRVLREQPDALIRSLVFTPYARDEYETLYDPAECPIEAARRLIVRSFMGMNSKGALENSGFDARINDDAYMSRVRSIAGMPEAVAAVAGRFTNVVIENCDAIKLIERYDRADTLIYADPPYVASTRSGKHYTHEMTDQDHSALIDRLLQARAMVVLSGYSTPLYDRALASWRRVEITAHTDGAHRRTEVLWMNPRCSNSFDAANLDLFSAMAVAAE